MRQEVREREVTVTTEKSAKICFAEEVLRLGVAVAEGPIHDNFN